MTSSRPDIVNLQQALTQKSTSTHAERRVFSEALVAFRLTTLTQLQLLWQGHCRCADKTLYTATSPVLARLNATNRRQAKHKVKAAGTGSRLAAAGLAVHHDGHVEAGQRGVDELRDAAHAHDVHLRKRPAYLYLGLAAVYVLPEADATMHRQRGMPAACCQHACSVTNDCSDLTRSNITLCFYSS